ncbi:MAG: 6,7-dimethyl-8-ribityllumazine synthase [Bdellovibrionales bacterium]|nr:6,7-dimethyl-8-ribityllumazine synthase [Bdellovibrionales bacterium]
MSLDEASKVLTSLPAELNPAKLREIAESVRRVTILRTLWYPEVLGPMTDSALQYLKSLGISEDSIETMTVPGSFELPLGVMIAAEPTAKKAPLDFTVALGCVVRGDTPHFDFVCAAASQGLMRAQIELKIPVGFGMLTVENLDQALARLDKGAEAAQAAFLMHANKCISSWV